MKPLPPVARAFSPLGMRLLVGACLCCELLGGPPVPASVAGAPADSITVTAPHNTTVAESDDYATQVLGDPWDMNNPDDLDYLDHMTPPSLANGIWTSRTTNQNSAIFLQYQGWPTSLDTLAERNGVNYPIDSRRYTHLRFRMYSSVADRMVAWWFPTRSFTPGGNSDFVTTQVGWHVYDIDLTSVAAGGTGTWGAAAWNGLRLDPVFALGHSGATIQFDWVRLTPATGPAVTVTWTATGSSPVSLYLDGDANASNGVERLIATGLVAGSGRYTWSTADLAPGTYYIRAVMGTAASYSGALQVNAAPVLDLTAPGPSTGEDFAETHLGYAWAMTSLSQVQQYYNLANISFHPGYMQASGNDDPQLWFLNADYAHAIDTSKYHYFSYSLYVARPPVSSGGQYPQWNAGERIIWTRDTSLHWQSTQVGIVWYDRWLYNAQDLRVAPREPTPYNEGWSGSEAIFRFDPHEEDGPVGSGIFPPYVRMGQMRLTADPTVPNGGRTTIAWEPGKTQGTVALYYSTTPGGARTLIATVPLSRGAYVWTVSGLAAGRYWITAIADDGLNTFTQVSHVPLTVAGSHPCPPAFSDVPAQNPFYTYINTLYCRNIAAGYSDTTFRPYSNAGRGTLARWVVLARGWLLSTGGVQHFADVPPTDPLYPYVETAFNHGVLSGYADGTFHPYADVTRGQMSKMIVNAMGWTTRTTGGPHFRDVSTTNAFYSQIETIYNRGLVSGYACGTGCLEFRWGNSLTRGQLSKVLANALGP